MIFENEMTNCVRMIL